MKKFDIRKFREKRGISQQKLAEEIGVDQATIHRWETGATIPGPAKRLLEQLMEE